MFKQIRKVVSRMSYLSGAFNLIIVLSGFALFISHASAEPINDIREKGYYYKKGFLKDQKVEVISVDRRNHRVKIYDPNTNEIYWVLPESLINTSESISRDINRIEITVEIVKQFSKQISRQTDSNSTMRGPFGSPPPSHDGSFICLYNFSGMPVELDSYFKKVRPETVFGDRTEEYIKITNNRILTIPPNGLRELRVEKDTYDSIYFDWKRTDMKNYVQMNTEDIQLSQNSACGTRRSRFQSAIVAGIYNPKTGETFSDSLYDCSAYSKKCDQLLEYLSN